MGLFAKPEEGIIEKYSVVYRGGHPSYKKSKRGGITFKVFIDKFILSPTIGTKWLSEITIKCENVIDITLEDKQVSTIEVICAGMDSRQLNRKNTIHIRYKDDDSNEIVLRLEMLSGFTTMGQAKKCLELEDLLRTKNIRKKFYSEQIVEKKPENIKRDITDKIEKLYILCEKGIISTDEFNTKKSELLARI